MDAAAAQACVDEVRDRIKSPATSPATEYKANTVLREKHRPVLRWLLGESGPVFGYAHVFLVDKTFLLIDRLVDLLVHESTQSTAAGLYREGRRGFGEQRWRAFLLAANTVLRARDRRDAGAPVDTFFQLLDTLRADGVPDDLRDVLHLLRQARARVVEFRTRLHDEPAKVPLLDPLIPALLRAVTYWGERGAPVSILHDRQNTLSTQRVAQLCLLAGDALTGLRLAESTSDPRLQVADYLAGAARKIASDQLNGRGDPQLTDLVRPYVDANSVWADGRSWAKLAPTPDPDRDSRR